MVYVLHDGLVVLVENGTGELTRCLVLFVLRGFLVEVEFSQWNYAVVLEQDLLL